MQCVGMFHLLNLSKPDFAVETEVTAQASETANATVTGCSIANQFSSPEGQGRTVAALVLTYMYRAMSNIASCIHQALRWCTWSRKQTQRYSTNYVFVRTYF